MTAGATTRVWQADLAQPRAWVEEAAIPALGPGEGERRTGESHRAWRRRVVGRAALRSVLARCLDRPADSLRFVHGPAGKPGLAAADGGERIHFNLSRSGDRCLVAVSEAGPVGVDVEAIRGFPELERLTRARFAPAEAADILTAPAPRRLRAFYACWTRKEATVKAMGIGLDEGLERVQVSVGDRPAILAGADGGDGWRLCDLDLGDGFAAAVALRDLRPTARSGISVEPLEVSVWPV